MSPQAPHEDDPPGRGTLAVVLVNFGSHRLLAELDLPVGPDRQVVVVDNFFSDDERAAAAALASDRGWTMLPQPTNLGFGAGVNVGVGWALEHDCEAILLLNPDARVSADVLTALHHTLLAERDALISPAMITGTGRGYFRGSQLDLRTGRTRGGWSDEPGRAADPDWVDWLTGACLGFHRDAWLRIGPFDEPFFLYWEDVDFSRRAARAGVRLVLRRDLVVVHDEGGTHRDRSVAPDGAGAAANRPKSSTYYYYNCRNRLLFGSRHLSRRGLLRWLLHTPAESRQILYRGGRAHLLRQPSHLVAGLRGSAAGVLRAVAALVSRPPAADA